MFISNSKNLQSFILWKETNKKKNLERIFGGVDSERVNSFLSILQHSQDLRHQLRQDRNNTLDAQPDREERKWRGGALSRIGSNVETKIVSDLKIPQGTMLRSLSGWIGNYVSLVEKWMHWVDHTPTHESLKGTQWPFCEPLVSHTIWNFQLGPLDSENWVHWTVWPLSLVNSKVLWRKNLYFWQIASVKNKLSQS